jgi:hypothetical protein
MIKKVFTLSPRELEIARLIAADEKPADMAAKLNISVKTVCTYRQRILEKLKRHGVRGNVGIALHLSQIERRPAEHGACRMSDALPSKELLPCPFCGGKAGEARCTSDASMSSAVRSPQT